MKWEVTGANRETGEDTSIQIEADTEESAIRRAGRRGVLASSAVPLSDDLDSVAAVEVVPPADPLSMLAAAAPAAAAVVPSNSHRPPRRPTELRPANGLGVAGLILGIVSLLICWIPLLGFLGLPLSILGLILAGVGSIMAISNRRTGFEFPIAGLAVCVAAIVVVIIVNGMFIAKVQQAITQASGAPTMTQQPSSAGPVQPVSPSAAVNTPKPAEQWVSCAEPVVLGDVTVRFIYSKIEKIPLKTGSEDGGESADPCLAIGISITNSSGTKKIDYSGWQGKAISLGGGTATLTDDAGNNYRRIDFGISKAAGQVDDVGIYPGQTINDVLVFEIPVPAAQMLKLEAPGSNVGARETLRWLIPALLPRMQPRGT